MRRVCLAVIAFLSSGVHVAKGQEATTMAALQRTFEMPAYRALIVVAQDGALSAFETDGCSGGMSWSWRVIAEFFPGFEAAEGAHPPWEDCCILHDRSYHSAGGANDADASYEARLEADNALRHCVANPADAEVSAMALRYEVSEDEIRFAHDLIASSMYGAVRFGGGPCTGLPWRWGFGYPACIPGF